MSKKQQAILHPDHPDGIYRYETPVIGGIRQYIQIRGKDKHNPVLLFLHGGPAAVLSGVTHIVHAGWEDHFTVVNWDQRNAGKTYFANKAQAKEISKTGTMDDFVQDIHEIIAYLHTVLDFEKIILMGFSWGTAIGTEYAKRHPENLHCVVSVGQLVNYRSGITFTCEKLLTLVPEGSADEKKVRQILSDMPETFDWNKMQWMRPFLPLCGKYIIKHAKRVPYRHILSSPFQTMRERLFSLLPNYALQEQPMVTMLTYDFRENLHFEVPVLFVFGAEETVCPPELVQECFAELSAPEKQITVIPEASHCCFYDQPEAFMTALNGFLGQIETQKGESPC